MDKHPTENPAGKAIHHFKVVGLLGLDSWCLPSMNKVLSRIAPSINGLESTIAI